MADPATKPVDPSNGIEMEVEVDGERIPFAKIGRSTFDAIRQLLESRGVELDHKRLDEALAKLDAKIQALRARLAEEEGEPEVEPEEPPEPTTLPADPTK